MAQRPGHYGSTLPACWHCRHAHDPLAYDYDAIQPVGRIHRGIESHLTYGKAFGESTFALSTGGMVNYGYHAHNAVAGDASPMNVGSGPGENLHTNIECGARMGHRSYPASIHAPSLADHAPFSTTLYNAGPYASFPTSILGDPGANVQGAFNCVGGDVHPQVGSGADTTATGRCYYQDGAHHMLYDRNGRSCNSTCQIDPFIAVSNFSKEDGCGPASEVTAQNFLSEGQLSRELGYTGPFTTGMESNSTSNKLGGAAAIGHLLHSPTQPLEPNALPFSPMSAAPSDALFTSHPLNSIPTDAVSVNVQSTTDQVVYRSQVGSEARAMASFRRRRQDHARRKPHECHQCPRTFTRGSSLREHLLRHENRKSYVCPFAPSCTARRNTASDLRSHIVNCHVISKAR